MKIDTNLKLSDLASALHHFWDHASEKTALIQGEYDVQNGSPVFTVAGKYSSRGWTEWTQGFQYGIPLLIFDATGNKELLEFGKESTLKKMAHHISHFGVHDHGFNNLSTYGNLLRMANQEKFDCTKAEKEVYRLALGISGAVQARRWSQLPDGGFIYSFNGPHSLFIDTMRTLRILVAAHLLGHRMLGENDEEIDLLQRALTHAMTTAKYGVYFGTGRDTYDVRGRTAHESIFNMNDGHYRCPNSQQGFSGRTTWTRGLAWAMLGFTEFLEFLLTYNEDLVNKEGVIQTFMDVALATCDFYIQNTSSDGIPLWDTGAPNIDKLNKYTAIPADPYNSFEPFDSSAAAIGAQALIRFGKIMKTMEPDKASQYHAAGLTVAKTLLNPPFLSDDPSHHGILLHSIYHRPNNWDYIPEGLTIPCGESSMWGDYHMTELCLLIQNMIKGGYYSFFDHLVIDE